MLRELLSLTLEKHCPLKSVGTRCTSHILSSLAIRVLGANVLTKAMYQAVPPCPLCSLIWSNSGQKNPNKRQIPAGMGVHIHPFHDLCSNNNTKMNANCKKNVMMVTKNSGTTYTTYCSTYGGHMGGRVFLEPTGCRKYSGADLAFCEGGFNILGGSWCPPSPKIFTVCFLLLEAFYSTFCA